MVGSQLKRFESQVSTEPCHAWRGADILHSAPVKAGVKQWAQVPDIERSSELR
jgi:hypothetical protein